MPITLTVYTNGVHGHLQTPEAERQELTALIQKAIQSKTGVNGSIRDKKEKEGEQKEKAVGIELKTNDYSQDHPAIMLESVREAFVELQRRGTDITKIDRKLRIYNEPEIAAEEDLQRPTNEDATFNVTLAIGVAARDSLNHEDQVSMLYGLWDGMNGIPGVQRGPYDSSGFWDTSVEGFIGVLKMEMLFDGRATHKIALRIQELTQTASESLGVAEKKLRIVNAANPFATWELIAKDTIKADDSTDTA